MYLREDYEMAKVVSRNYLNNPHKLSLASFLLRIELFKTGKNLVSKILRKAIYFLKVKPTHVDDKLND